MKRGWAAKSANAVPGWAKRANTLPHPAQTYPKRRWTRTTLKSCMAAASLPAFWIALAMQALDSLETDSSLIGIEVFSGMHRLSTEFRNLVGGFETFEIHDTSDENILLKRVFSI